MTTIRTTLFAFGFAALGALGTASLTAAADDGPERHRGNPMQKVLDGVELTEAQQASLEAMKDEMKAEREEHRAERTERLDTMVELLEAETIDRQAIYTRIDEKLAQKREILVKRADFMMDFIDTLDDDQKAQVLENLAEAEVRMEERRSSGEETQGRRPRGR